jgi:ribosomal protein L3
MSLGLVGRKVGMTRIFAEDGKTIPVTVLDVSNNRVSQIKTIETDGYAAVQVAYGKRRASRMRKPARVISPRRASSRRGDARNSASRPSWPAA